MANLVFAGRDRYSTLASIIGYVPANHNIFPWSAFGESHDFTVSAWAKTRLTISTGHLGVTSLLNCNRLIPSVDNDTHKVEVLPVAAGGSEASQIVQWTSTPVPCRFCFIAKAAGYTRLVFSLKNYFFAEESFSIGMDLTGGEVNYDIVTDDFTVTSASATLIREGWWKIIIDVVNNASPFVNAAIWHPQLYVDNGSGTDARSITFAGNGTSGVDVFFCGWLPKAAWQLTNQLFNDDFDSLDTIDMENTKAPGFNWYRNGIWPYSSYYDWNTAAHGISDADTFSISSPSVLKIQSLGPNQHRWNATLMTVVENGPGEYIGQAWQPPFCWDSYVSWDGTIASYEAHKPAPPGDGTWNGAPAIWCQSMEMLVGTVLDEDSFIEWDMIEGTWNDGDNSGLHAHWDTPTVNWPEGPFSGGYNLVTLAKKPMVEGVFTRWSGIYLREIDTGTNYGMTIEFHNGTFVRNSDRYFSSTVDVNPPYPIGSHAHGDLQYQPIILTSAANTTATEADSWPFYLDWIRVYGKPG